LDLLEELQAIHDKVARDPKNVDEKVRRRFWRLVGKIKRMSKVEKPVIVKASEIRDLLYEHRLGKPRALQWLIIWLLGAVVLLAHYLWIILYGQGYTGELVFDLWYVMGYRAATVMGMVFLLYPLKLDGITRDIYYMPTLKINYITYLEASPPSRQWFFFFSGYWTAFTAIWVGAIGLILGGEWIGIIVGIILGLLETLGAIVGGFWGGELGHFHRERRIVRDWKRSKES
jgi:hypothetical protein